MVFGLFNKTDVEKIVELYEENCGLHRSLPYATHHHNSRSLLQSIKYHNRNGEAEFRWGSRWNQDSKVRIRHSYFRSEVRVRFDLNFNPDEMSEEDIPEAKRAGKEFERLVGEYLTTPPS